MSLLVGVKLIKVITTVTHLVDVRVSRTISAKCF